MSDIQELEVGRHYGQLKKDVRELVDKYLRIADWDVPDIDEAETFRLVLRAIRRALDEVEKER